MAEFKTEHNKLTDAVKPLDSQVNLNMYQPFPSSHFLYCCCGGIGAGKSSIILNLLDLDKSKGGFRRAFNKIYVISPTASQDSKFARLIEEVESDGNFYEECDDEAVEEIMDKIKYFNDDFKSQKKNKGKEPSSLLIVDDCADQFSKKRKNKLNRFVLTLRHLKCSVFILSQKLNAIPPIIRAQARAITFFPTLNSKEEQCLIDEINIDKDLFRRLIDFCTAGDEHAHNFLHIKLGHGKPIFFKKFDRIVI